MIYIEDLRKLEKEIIRKISYNLYETDENCYNEIIKFLKKIPSTYDEIIKSNDFRWINKAINKWESFLKSEYHIVVTTPFPELDTLPELKDDTVSIDEFESKIGFLKSVYIVSKEAQVPTGKLRDAVIYNIHRGTKYTFLVSNDWPVELLQELKGEYIKIVQKELNKHVKYSEPTGAQIEEANKFIFIFQLKFNWNYYPQIFYIVLDEKNEKQLLGLRGTTMSKTIAERYRPIPSKEAEHWYYSLFSDTPSLIQVDQFVEDPDQVRQKEHQTENVLVYKRKNG